MKIGMILDTSFPPDPRVRNEAITLISDGHEVHLFCVDYSKKQKRYEEIDGIRIHRYFPPKIVYKLSALAYSLPFYHLYFKNKIRRFIEKTNIEHIHVHDIPLAKCIFNVNKEFNLPITLDLHENRPEIMKYYSHTNTFFGKLLINPDVWKRNEYDLIKRAAKVIIVTEQAKEFYLNEINTEANKFVVVPNSVNESFYKNHTLEKSIIEKYSGNFTVLYLGDTGVRRGLMTVIQSFKYLIPKIPNIKFVIVGESKDDDQLKTLILDLGLTKYIDLLGWQDVKLFPSYIKASSIGVCPIHRNLHHDTTYANKIFQLMSFGKPIIVSDCTAQKKLVEEYKCGLVFKDRDENDFADQLLNIYKDQELYNLYSINARKAIVDHLKWEILSQDLSKIYAV